MIRKKAQQTVADDVKTGQGLLNIQIVRDGRRDEFLAVDGGLGRETMGAILEFQRRHGLPQSGLIERGDATIRALANFSGPRSMRVSSDLVDFIRDIERFGALPYDDAYKPVPNATIGYGHKLHSGQVSEADLEKWGPNGISRASAGALLRQDLGDAEKEVNNAVRVPLTQNQFDALVSLAINIRYHSFRNSTLLGLLNHGDYENAAGEFARFLRSGAGHPKGLPARREDEEERFRER